MRPLTPEETKEIQERCSDLSNFASDDIFSPIDPLTYVNPEGDTLLHIAAMRGDARTVELLIAAGADPNSLGDMGNTPLHYAFSNGGWDVAKILIDSGAREDIRNEFGRPPSRQ